MTQAEILSKLSEIVGDVLDVEGVVLTGSMTAKDVPGWDSLAHIRIILATEKAFRLRFDTAEMAGLQDVGAMADMIARKAG